MKTAGKAAWFLFMVFPARAGQAAAGFRVSGSCANMMGTFIQVSPARTGVNFYLETSFATAAGSIPSGDQTGDYSFDPAKSSSTDWDHPTLYRNGV